MTDSEDRSALRARINAETARIDWHELERHFARGMVLRVGSQADLVDIGVAMALDDEVEIGQALESGRLARATDADATAWQGKTLWAVVVAPWVLVQERDDGRPPVLQ